MTKFEETSSVHPPLGPAGGGASGRLHRRRHLTRNRAVDRRRPMRKARKPPLTPDQLSSYIAVNADGSVSAFFGKTDLAQGLFIAIGQIVAEELDVPFKSVKVIMGDTANSVNQGGASGSTGIQLGGKQMRMAAAEARRVLVEMAANQLSVPADKLVVSDGIVSAIDTSSKGAPGLSYAELIGGKYFNVQLDWNKKIGNELYAPGKAQPKKPSEYKIVGKSIRREDIAPKVFCQQDYITDIKLPGMVHGRVIRPPVAGAMPVKVDEDSIKDIAGGKVVVQNGFPRRRRRHGMGRHPGRAETQSRMVEGDAAVSGSGVDLRPHPQGAGAQTHGRKGKRRRRRGLQDRRARDRGRVRVAVPIARQHGSRLRHRRV